MPGKERLLRCGAEVRQQELIDEPKARVEKSPVAGGPVVRNGALKQMANVIELMAPLLRLRLHALRASVLDVVGVEVSVGLLGGHDFVDIFIDESAKLRSIRRLQREPRRFNPFINVRIGVNRTALWRCAFARKPAEIVHATVDFKKLAHRRNAGLDVRLPARRPETRFDGHRVDWYVAQLCVRRLRQVKDGLVAPRRLGG